jgi:hypothetical protein
VPYKGPAENWLTVLDPDGTPASDFDSQPALGLTLPKPSVGFRLNALAWDHQGRLLMTGGAESAWDAPDPCIAFIARFRPDGSRDDDFAESGLGLFPGSFSTFPSCELRSLLVQPDGRILADLPGASRPNGTADLSPTVARFLAAPGGPDDADADGVVDSEDACPRRAAEHPDGCQRAEVPIDLERRGRSFRGTVEAHRACLTNPNDIEAEGGFRPILLYRERDGEDELVGRTQLRGKRFEFGRKPRGHSYYAQLPEMLQPGVVVCRQARSSAVGLLKLKLGAAKRQKPGRRLHARARCDGVDCKLAARAVVRLKRPGRKNLKLRSGRVRTKLEAGERKRLTFKLKRRDAKRLRRTIRNSDQARKRSRVIFKARARAGGQSDRAKKRARLRRG